MNAGKHRADRFSPNVEAVDFLDIDLEVAENATLPIKSDSYHQPVLYGRPVSLQTLQMAGSVPHRSVDELCNTFRVRAQMQQRTGDATKDPVAYGAVVYALAELGQPYKELTPMNFIDR